MNLSPREKDKLLVSMAAMVVWLLAIVVVADVVVVAQRFLG